MVIVHDIVVVAAALQSGCCRVFIKKNQTSVFIFHEIVMKIIEVKRRIICTQ